MPAALRSRPVRIPLPREVQGEAVTIEPDGTLLSAGEGADQPVRELRDAVSLLPPPPPAHGDEVDRGSASGKGLATGPAIVVTGAMIGVVALAWGRLRRLRAGRRGRRG